MGPTYQISIRTRTWGAGVFGANEGVKSEAAKWQKRANARSGFLPFVACFTLFNPFTCFAISLDQNSIPAARNLFGCSCID
jgi:hypothetical protein